MNWQGILIVASMWIVPVLLAVTLHEAAHGWVAWKLGDDTARRMGRVTFNPIRHIDPFGTVLLPAMLLYFSGGSMMFGFAKPVPVNFRRLLRPRRDMVLVAAAGPGINLLLAVVSASLIHLAREIPGVAGLWVGYNLENSLVINVFLCIFNLIPLPPLDGGRIAIGLLPGGLARPLARLERAGILIVLGVVFVLPWIGGRLGLDLNVFWWLVGVPANHVIDFILRITGVN